MSFGIEPKKLKSLIDLYYPNNHGEELRYMIHLKGEEELFRNLETCPFQGISVNSIEDRESAFGKNILKPRQISIMSILLKSLSSSYIFLSIFLSMMLIFYDKVSGEGQILEGIIILCTTVLNWLLRAAEYIYLSLKWAKTDADINDVSCTVVRQNKREKIFSSELTVGDVVEFRQGDTIPADGWVIQGFDICIIQKYLSENVECEKDNLRKCISDIKAVLEKNPSINQKNITFQEVKSPKSPVVIGGSTVKSGEGRMIVLCVGKYSRQGQFLDLSRQRLEPNILKQKIQQLRSVVYSYIMVFALVYSLIYFGQNVQKAMNMGHISHLLDKQLWTNLKNGFFALLFGAPLGLYQGLMLGLLKIKVRMWFTDSIWVDYAQDLPRMAAVTEICYDREKNWGKMQNREWWNEQRVPFRKQESDEDQKQVQITQQDVIDDGDMSQQFRTLMRRGLKLKGSEQPGHHYFVSPETILKKNTINDWNVFQETISQTNINYLCVGNTVKYQSLGDLSLGVVLIKGQSRDILSLCTKMLMKSTGQEQSLNINLRTEINDVIQSMERRLVTTHAIAYVKQSNPNLLQSQIQAVIRENLTFLCILGVTNSRDHSDYEIVRQLRQAGVSLVLVSSRSHAQAVSRSKFIGINTIQQDSLVLDSNDFAKVVGGVICFTCKKTFCQCADDADHDPRLKNLEQFRRITKYLKVMSSANFYQKYSIMIGYKNVGRLTAFMGTEQEDRPAQAAAYLSIASEGGVRGSQMRFPSNSIRTLQRSIAWSRFATQYARKLIQLMLPASIVAVSVILLSGVLFRTSPLAPIQVFWVCIPLCIASAINLSWEKPQEQLHQQAIIFGPQSPLISEPVRKQIISQCIFQTLLLLLLLDSGHQFLPESSDGIDDKIGANWQAKYSDINKNTMASGLTQNFLFGISPYGQTFATYGVYSRHLTFVFNTFAMMQIFNYFNCRKIGSKEINVLQGLDWHNALFFILTIASHCLFVQVASQSAQLYTYGLTIQQWLLSAALAIIVWIVGFLVRLLPDSSHMHLNKRLWRNKSYNLNVKLVGKSDKFYEFDRDQDAMFKFH